MFKFFKELFSTEFPITIIKVVDHNNQRYNTVGDYFSTFFGKKIFKISKLGDWRMVFLIAIHELVESFLCKHAGVTDEMIDEFDLWFEKKRKSGDMSEPGDDPHAPYHKQHMFATKIEKMLAEQLDVHWEEYCARCDSLTNSYKK